MYRVEITGVKDSAFKVRSGNYEFDIDIKGKGISPADTLLASLGSCIGVYLRKYAQACKLVLDNFCISAEAEFSKEPPVCFKEIYVSIDLKGMPLDEARQRALLEFIKDCPIHNTLKVNPQIEVKIV